MHTPHAIDGYVFCSVKERRKHFTAIQLPPIGCYSLSFTISTGLSCEALCLREYLEEA